ncbi:MULTISPECIES: PstS family phosphate ABC transporter substrate-binding protein [Bacteroides]|jgi:phosphate transport system substrate-binding protein|uniref:PstS family phosphate ABC transporter substrate-binding protein n=1 Tax=Bacteroides TaxID=816 RepID=UPI0005CC6EDB|nr:MULTISPECIES: substrate-binding domain-containing protein [Bacteroides]
MMKRQFWLIGIVLLLALSACRSKSKEGQTDTYSSGVIAIAADASFEPIIQEEIDVFESLYPLAGIVPRYTTEVEAINLLLKDSVRLAVATRTLTEEEMNSFHSRKFYPREIKLATDALALIVNRANPDSLLSVRDFRRILTGEAKTWKQVNSNSGLKDIQVVFDNKNSSTVRFAMDSVCGGKPLATENVSALKTNQQVIDFVAKNPAAIGVIGVNWLGNRSDTTNLSFKEEIRVMAVSAGDVATPENSYKPYQAYLYYGNYPLARPIYAILNDPRNGLPWGFTSFMTSDKGQRIILKSGLVPATQPVRIVHVKDE